MSTKQRALIYTSMSAGAALLLLLAFFFILPGRVEAAPTAPSASSILINEMDADQASTDNAEFVELYDGGVGNTDLTGLVLVFFNGSDDASYTAFDLDGYSTDPNGYFVLCGDAVNVANCDLDVDTNTDLIQNGADAVALYQADATDFPNDTPVTTVNLLDAIVYDTDDSDDAALLVLLNADQPQINENAGGNGTVYSNQRCPNGSGGARNTMTVYQNTPTPGMVNNCQLLLLSEVVVTPTDGEFIEIYNPGTQELDLSNVYLTDATYTGGNTYYYNIVTGSNAGGGNFSDFHARFPDGASINPGEYQVIAIAGSDNFTNTYGIYPTYELYEDGASSDSIPDMREALAGSINNQGGLTNDGEVVILYYWDGLTDLVTDLDYVVWGDKVEAVAKTGIFIDGPDTDVLTSTYQADTAIGSQDVVATGAHVSGETWQREDLSEGTETLTGGNGANGHDETSENLSVTWCEELPSPLQATPCGADQPPTVSSTAPADNATDVQLNANISIEFSENVTVTGTWYDITCDSSGAHSAVVSGGPQNFTLNPDANFAGNEVCTVTVYAAQVTDQDGTIDNLAADYIFDFTTLTPVCGNSATLIHAIQGNGSSSPELGNVHTIEGVVVGDFQTSAHLSGFFLQEEDTDADTDTTTSEGIFVYDGSVPDVDVNVGEVVRVTGTVDEYNNLTELKNLSYIEVCLTSGVASPAMPTLPVTSVDDWEWYEGMQVHITQTLYATENYNQGRYGEVVLSVNGRLDTPTNVVEPGVDAIALQDLNDRSSIQMDDGRSSQNPIPPAYIGDDNTLRAGDALPGLTGVLGYGFGAYEIHPTEAITFTRVNTRETSPFEVGGTHTIASFNVLNYFVTLDTGSPICGPTGGMECRGADNEGEFNRQRTKIITALLTIDADVIGLMEIENHPTDAAVQDLVSGLNAVAGAGTYAAIDTGTIGTDAIKVALLYQPAKVTPVGAYAVLDSSVDATFLDDKNRPSLAQTFADVVTGEKFTVAVNHFKSKGSSCDDINDPDTGDGQGNCNLTRTAAATALVNWLATDPTSSGTKAFLIIGDLNSYAKEDPIGAIKADGYANLLETLVKPYSYVFMGQAGYLDHALANPNLEAMVSGVTIWHINADEPSALDYNDYNLPLGLYYPDQYRASDHDPVIIGLDLKFKLVLPLIIK